MKKDEKKTFLCAFFSYFVLLFVRFRKEKPPIYAFVVIQF